MRCIITHIPISLQKLTPIRGRKLLFAHIKRGDSPRFTEANPDKGTKTGMKDINKDGKSAFTEANPDKGTKTSTPSNSKEKSKLPVVYRS